MSGVERALPVGATLGEGPAWFADALWFVDIKAPAVHRFDPSCGAHRRWPAPAQVGWVLPATDGTILAGLQTGLHGFDAQTGRFTLLEPVEPDQPGNRLNDAAVDRAGRLWFGSMDDGESLPSGAVYRRDRHGLHRAFDGIVITNGPAVSPDGGTLYHHDTLARTIFASRLDKAGRPHDTRLFASIDPADGYPDGPVVDADGCLWVGLWGGWGVRRYDPEGRAIATVRMPVANVTKIAFGGPDLRTAYATTARKGLSDADLGDQPMAGDLFAFDAGVAGLPQAAVDRTGWN